MEYAIIEIGGNQFRVKKGDKIQADFALGKAKKAIKIDKVLLYRAGKDLEVGTPYVKGASVSCDIAGEVKTKKIIVYKYKRRKSCKFKKGHRQRVVALIVKEINT